MGHRTGHSPLELRLFRTVDHECGYFDDRLSQDLVIDPNDPALAERFEHALGWGFRRSGDIVYTLKPGYFEAEVLQSVIQCGLPMVVAGSTLAMRSPWNTRS